MRITAKQAAERAGCSISTLRRYECGWCGQLKLHQYQGLCGAIWDKCDAAKLPKFYDDPRLTIDRETDMAYKG